MNFYNKNPRYNALRQSAIEPALNMVVAHKSANNSQKPTKGLDYRTILHMIIQSRIKKHRL